MKSMTGYGTSRVSTKEIDLELSIKSINGRFLDCRVHLPREYAPYEIEIKKKITQLFRRGTVDVYINRRIIDPSQQMGVVVNTGMAKKWLKAYKELAAELNIRENPSLHDIASLPQVMSVREVQSLLPSEKKDLFALLSKSLKLCEQERVREGKALKIELTTLLKNLEKLVKEMQSQISGQGEFLKKRLEQKLSLSGLEGRMDPQRLAQEIAIQLDRGDITEELTRLREHITHFGKLMRSKDVQGKKLDFYTQELLREVNTIGSKSQAAQLTETVVNAKALVERIREQVQNIE